MSEKSNLPCELMMHVLGGGGGGKGQNHIAFSDGNPFVKYVYFFTDLVILIHSKATNLLFKGVLAFNFTSEFTYLCFFSYSK